MIKETMAIVLAAGKGTRMKSDRPKVLHEVFGKPLLEWVVKAVGDAGITRILVVVGHQGERVREAFKDSNIEWVDQREQLGTAHAVRTTVANIDDFSGTIVVLPGDAPLITAETIRNLIKCHNKHGADCTVLTTKLDNPKGYGRILRDAAGRVTRIAEEIDARTGEREIKEINSGIYCFNAETLFKALDTVKPDNKKGEYYLTDVVAILHKTGKKVEALCIPESAQILGINTVQDLEGIERCTEMSQKYLRLQLV